MTDTEWQEERNLPAPVSRGQMFTMLMSALEQIETAYVMGGIDRAEYLSQLEELDGKLGIVGLTLAIKPWIKTATVRI